ncbi:hypothetical protein FBEOM_4774 [Fusarium beomiforme]|uniref:Uncharacterized protein n=1 Tax=Fusarium beomiforme TaxID=44412 RepID=A0A9P5AM74_9HYPO|nr:hypothetical protein FBEOM_4774 [Fusarium beomiforme]
MSHKHMMNSGVIPSPNRESSLTCDSNDGSGTISHVNDNPGRGHIHFAAELGSAVEEMVTSMVARHGGSGINKSLAWEAIQSLARSKLDGLTGNMISQWNQNHLFNESFSTLENPLARSEGADFLYHYAPLMTDLNAFFHEEQPPSFENTQGMDIPELGHITYDDGPFSLWQMPIPSPSSGTITLPTNSPSSQEPWPDGSSIDTSITGTTHTIIATPGISRREKVPKQKHGLEVPQARSNHTSIRRSFRSSTKRSIRQSDRATQSNNTSSLSKRPRPGRPSARPSCARYFKGSRTIFHDLYRTRIQSLLDNVAEWLPVDSLNPVDIEISNGYTPILQVSLRPYIPFNHEALTHILFRGTEAGMTTPRAESTAFSLEDGTLTSKKIDDYCDSLAFDLALNEGKQATNKNRLARYILMFATTQCEGPQEGPSLEGISLVKLALRFWAIQAVFFKYPWTIVKGASLIGMSPLLIPGCWYGKTLLPRLVNQQLDEAFEIRMDELEKEILEKLQDMVLCRERSKYWCAIFLTTFILLNSLEKDSWNMHAWEHEKARNGGTPWPLKRDPSDYYRQNKHIADTLTTYFHIVTNGSAPFALDWTKASHQGLLAETTPARMLIESIQRDLQDPQSSYGRELNVPNEFRRDDVESLNYSYTRRLVLG